MGGCRLSTEILTENICMYKLELIYQKFSRPAFLQYWISILNVMWPS